MSDSRMNGRENADAGEPSAHVLPIAVPIGDVGRAADRDARGRWSRGNVANILTGERSRAFWAEAEAERRRLEDAALRDRGFTSADAPVALAAAAGGLAQALLVRESAFVRMLEAGGPLSSSGRPRRAYAVWLAAADRVVKHAQVLGFARDQRDVPLSELLNQEDA